MRIKTPDKDGCLRANLNGWQIEAEKWGNSLLIRNRELVIFFNLEWNALERNYETTVKIVTPKGKLSPKVQPIEYIESENVWGFRIKDNALVTGEGAVVDKIPSHHVNEEDATIRDIAKQEIEKLKMSFQGEE